MRMLTRLSSLSSILAVRLRCPPTPRLRIVLAGSHALFRRWHRSQGAAGDAVLRLHLHLALAQPAQACPYGTGCGCTCAGAGFGAGSGAAGSFSLLRCWGMTRRKSVLQGNGTGFGIPSAVVWCLYTRLYRTLTLLIPAPYCNDCPKESLVQYD